jgi:transcriptional regulator with XRE-family HTH domain
LGNAPYLRKLREQKLLSQRQLAKQAEVDRRSISDIEAGRREARPVTLRRLANALGMLPEDLTGERAASPEAHEAYLDSLAVEKKTFGPGDSLFDNDPIASMTDAELAEYVRKNPEAHYRISVLLRQHAKIVAGIEQETREREAENAKDAG